MQDPEQVREAFVEPEEFWSSPLYRTLSRTVAQDPALVGLAAHARAGQGPTFAFFAAVHALLLAGADHPLADYYPSLGGDAVRPPDDRAGALLAAFAQEHAAQLQRILHTRLVQTNQVGRATGLRLGLVAVAPHAPAVHLLEVGCSAGLLLRHDCYGYRVGGRHFGDRASPVQLAAEWRSTEPVPDLDAVPELLSRTGADLNPLDPADAADRAWLEALVWPEDRAKAELLHAALALAVEHPVPLLAGDAIDLCPVWVEGLPPGEPRVVFHSATRMHVPADRLAAFDDAIAGVGDTGPFYVVEIGRDGLTVTGPGGARLARYDVEGHLGWISPG